MPSERFYTFKNWRGLQTNREAKEIPWGKSPSLSGCDLRTGTALVSERGYTEYGNLNQSGGRITSAFTAERRDGRILNFITWDDGTTARLYWLNELDTTNDTNGEWEQLVVSLTTGYPVRGVGFNTVSADSVIFGNAIQQSRTWNAAYTRLTAATVGGEATITVASTTGFDASGDLVITSTTGVLTAVTYTGTTATTFTGCAGVPAARANRGVAQTTVLSAAAPWSNKWISADGRVWCIGVSGSDGSTSIRLFFSTVGDATDWTAGTTPDSAGFRDFPELGGEATGLASLRGSSGDFTIWVGGRKGIASYALEFPSSTTRVAKSRTFRDKSGVAVITHDGIANVVNDIWFATPDNGVISLFSPTFKDGFDTDHILEEARGTTQSYDFGEAAAIYWDREKRYLLACKTDPDYADNDIVIDVQLVKDPESGGWRREINLLPWAASSWMKRDDILLFGSSVSPNVYRAFNGFSAANAPISFSYATKRFSEFPELGLSTFNEKRMRYFGIIGLIAPGSDLDISLFFDAGGIRGQADYTLRSLTDSGLVLEANTPATLGQFPLGEHLLGSLIEDTADLNPFYAFFSVPEEYTFFDGQFEFSGSRAGYRVKIEELGFVVEDAGHKVPESRLKGTE